MVRRRADIRKTQRHVCRLSVSDELDGNEPLVVVRRDHDVEFSRMRAVVKAIGRVGPGDVDSIGRAMADGRREDVDVFPAEHSAFSGMRIDRSHRNAPAIELESLQLALDESDQIDVVLGGNLRESIAQGDMNRREDDFERWGEEGHRILPPSGALSKKVCLAVESLPDGFFADGSGDDGVDASGQGRGAGSIQVGERALPGVLAEFSPLDARRISAGVAQKKNRLFRNARKIVDPAPGHTRSKAVGIAFKDVPVDKQYPARRRQYR